MALNLLCGLLDVSVYFSEHDSVIHKKTEELRKTCQNRCPFQPRFQKEIHFTTRSASSLESSRVGRGVPLPLVKPYVQVSRIRLSLKFCIYL